jgi:hypothetical protein
MASARPPCRTDPDDELSATQPATAAFAGPAPSEPILEARLTTNRRRGGSDEGPVGSGALTLTAATSPPSTPAARSGCEALTRLDSRGPPFHPRGTRRSLERHPQGAESAQRHREHSWGELDPPGASPAIESCKQQSSSRADGGRVAGIGHKQPQRRGRDAPRECKRVSPRASRHTSCSPEGSLDPTSPAVR